ncbi:MAG: hypothetical protein LBI67_06135 [Treponema sp.]|jgi:outer membrane protein assembly factor BamB|nr:hypothetical protein [Treponema sp.]
MKITLKIAKIILVVAVLTPGMLCSCKTNGVRPPSQDTGPELFPVRIINNTDVDVEFIDETRLIPRRSEKTVLIPEPSVYLNSGFKVYYRLELLNGMYLSVPRTENIIISPEQDTAPPINSIIIDFKESFLTIQNNSKETITLNQNSGATVYINPLAKLQPGRIWQESPYLRPGSRGLYDKLTGESSFLIETDMYKRIALNPANVKPSSLYAYSFDGASVTLLDERPLHRTGENAWVKTMADAAGRPVFLGGNAITVLAPENQTIGCHSFDSTGHEQGPPVSMGENFTLNAAIPSRENAVLLAGHAESVGDYSPVVNLYAGNGSLRSSLAPSELPEHYSAFFLTAAQKDEGSWLAAGGARDLKGAGYGAYLRMIRETGSGLVCDWELGPGGFNAKTPEDEVCHEVISSTYDKNRDRWLLAGYYENMRTGQNGAYTAEVSGQGRIQNINAAYTNIEFNKIVLDAAGAWYLAGQEYKGNDSYAVLIKYGADGKEQWRQKSQSASHSWYQDAMVDEVNRRIVLCGTLRAVTKDGSGGAPFIEALDMESGALLWREDAETWRRDNTPLSEDITKTSLALSVVRAPDYGFALILSALANGETQKPYILVRVNSQGKIYAKGEQR